MPQFYDRKVATTSSAGHVLWERRRRRRKKGEGEGRRGVFDCSSYLLVLFSIRAFPGQGLIPLYLGAPNVFDFPFTIKGYPYGVFLDDFDSVEDLAQFINAVSRNDDLYEKFHEWRRAGPQSLSQDYQLLFNRMRPPFDHEKIIYTVEKGFLNVRKHGKEAVIDFW